MDNIKEMHGNKPDLLEKMYRCLSTVFKIAVQELLEDDLSGFKKSTHTTILNYNDCSTGKLQKFEVQIKLKKIENDE